MIAPARLAAYDVLRAVHSGGVDLPAALARARTRLPDERDRALAAEIATGTLRWRGAFDHLIAAYAGRGLDRLDPEAVDILRLTLFQLLHLDRVPASAAVNDAVHLVRKVGIGSAAPFVNAVLRRASRERDRLPLPPRPAFAKATADRPACGQGTVGRSPGDAAAELDYLEQTLSHPRWLVERWRDRHGFEAAETWCRFNNSSAPLTIRANRLKTTAAALAGELEGLGVVTRPAQFAPDALVVERGNPLLTRLDGQGWFVVQDEASQLVAVLAGAAAGERVLDVCGAPGGKTTAMAAEMGDRGLVVSMDVRPRRVRLLAESVRAAGARSVRVLQGNAAMPLPFAAIFDLVLIDAPCSGLGTVRRDPEIKWRRGPGEFEALAALQGRILRSAAAAVRPGGRLMYSTCSSEPEENEAVVARFLREDASFELRPLQLPSAPQLINPAGQFRSYPFRDGLESFFAASLVKAAALR